MKRAVSLTLMIALLANCTHFTKSRRVPVIEEPIVISERVGEVMDAEERDYYGLFPRLYIHPLGYAFESAEFFGLEGGGYEVRIATGHNTLAAQNQGENAVDILRDYIDHYEEIVNSSKLFEEKWDIVGYDDLGQPITGSEIKSTSTACSLAPSLLGGCAAALVLGVWITAALFGSMVEAAGGEAEVMGIGEAAGLSLVLGLTGALIGREVSRAQALAQVKKSRKLRILE